jgi:hypothetical protein
MIWKSLLLPACLLLFGTAHSQKITRLQVFEQARYKAILEADLEKMEDMLSGELVYTHSNCTVENKKEYLEALRSGKYRFTQFETDSTLYRLLDRRTVVGTGIARMAGNVFETPFQLRSRYTAIYVWEKRRWRLHTWQTTKCLN